MNTPHVVNTEFNFILEPTLKLRWTVRLQTDRELR